MPKITKIHARQILDSRGNPTIEAIVFTDKSIGIASVPSGASTGTHEAVELRDNQKEYLGQSVHKAIKNITTILSPKLIGQDCAKQETIDKLMCKLDGTKNKNRLGANATLAVSLACTRAAANSLQIPLYEYLQNFTKQHHKIPKAFFNVINGGKHAGTKLVFQEFMIVPQTNSFSKNLQIASEVYHTLKIILKQKYGSSAINVGDEGGFAPPLQTAEQALDLLTLAIKQSGYNKQVSLAMDCAASEFYNNGYYYLPKKTSPQQLIDYYLKLIKKYNLISIEDPFHEEDFLNFSKLKNKTKIQIVADDLTTTNPERIKLAIKYNSANCLLLKVNQIGTLTEALTAANLARKNGWKIMVAHRSGETEDTFIADLSVALACGQIKSGAPCRGERTAKYNQLLRIEELLKKNS